MAVSINQSAPGQGWLQRETDQVRTEVVLEREEIEQLHASLASVLNDGGGGETTRHIMVERRPKGPAPVYVQITRDDILLPMYFTENEAGSLAEDAREFLAEEDEQ